MISSPRGLLSGRCPRLSIAHNWVSRSNVHCVYVTITQFDIACQIGVVTRVYEIVVGKRTNGVLHIASNYNLVLHPAVLLVNEGWIQVMERRETYDDLLSRYGDV